MAGVGVNMCVTRCAGNSDPSLQNLLAFPPWIVKHVFVCMCICACILNHVCKHVCTFVCESCVSMYTYMDVHVCVNVCGLCKVALIRVPEVPTVQGRNHQGSLWLLLLRLLQV